MAVPEHNILSISSNEKRFLGFFEKKKKKKNFIRCLCFAFENPYDVYFIYFICLYKICDMFGTLFL